MQHGGRRGVIDLGRDKGAFPVFDNGALRIPTVPKLPRDPVARFKTRDLRAHGNHHAGDLCSRRIWQVGAELVATFRHQLIHEADGCRPDIDQDFIIGGFRCDGITDFQGIGALEIFAYCRAHQTAPPG